MEADLLKQFAEFISQNPQLIQNKEFISKQNTIDENEIIDVSCTKCTYLFKNNSTHCPMCGSEYIDPVEENYMKAYQEIPHTFIKQEMIHLKGTINGHEINFLVDTGAAISVIPQNFINACGLSNIVDKQCKGKLLGVGTADIIGRIHYVELFLPNGMFPCSFTISSNNDVPPILGIDMMYNLGMSIDFKNRKLKFLDDSEIRF